MRKVTRQRSGAENKRLLEGLRTLPVIEGGRTLEEIAQHCGVPRSTVYMAEQRAMQTIRRRHPELLELLWESRS
jgi:DNA-directed RNA polymerase sigma subunit (sigma70/sigma32)